MLASLSFFKEGVTRLYISLETYGESSEKPSTSHEHTEDDEPEGATAMTIKQFPVKQVERDVIDTTSDLHEVTGNLKIASEERYQLAKKSFEEAKRLATEAFNNTALSTEERVMASKLRIASRILGGLDDPEAAVHDFLLYLKELQDLPAVQAMFTVWREKGFTSRLRARFNQTERNDVVASIQLVNGMLLNLTLEFTNKKMGCLSWPMINIGKEIYHPILHNEKIVKELEKKGTTGQVPWMRQFHTNINEDCAVTSKGKILSTTSSKDDQHGLKITKSNGDCSVFCTIPSENDGDILNKICCFAVDENDKVFIIIEISSRRKNIPTQYKLLTFDENGNAIADRTLDIIEELWAQQMSVTKDGKLVIYCNRIKSMYICDSTNVEKDYKLPLPLKNVRPDDIYYWLKFTVSDQNEIIYIFAKIDVSTFLVIMHLITMDGTLKREVTVLKTTEYVVSMNVVFNHLNKTILVSTHSYNRIDNNTFFSFSKTGELLYELKIPGWYYDRIISKLDGFIAVVSGREAIMLQM